MTAASGVVVVCGSAGLLAGRLIPTHRRMLARATHPTLVAVMCFSNGPPQQKHLDWHPVTVEFMIFVISALTSAKVREIMNELDRCDPLHHLEPELIFAAQP